MRPLRGRAPAKINLTLEVVGRLPDGYHAIRSIFVRLPALFDTVEVTIDSEADALEVRCNDATVPSDESNLCHRAALLFLARIGERGGGTLQLEKGLPVAAGLGGGSSDAATTLLLLNRHFGDRLDGAELGTLGASIGKDIPFFLAQCDAAFVHGSGEHVESLGAMPRLHWLLVNPGFALSTAVMYSTLSRDLRFMNDAARVNRSAEVRRAIEGGDVFRLAAATYNDFETIAEVQQPIIKELKQALLAFGAVAAGMSGSGPTVFGMFTSREVQTRAHAAMARHYPGMMIAAA